MKKKLIILFCVLLGLSWYTAISEIINNPKEVAAHLETAANFEAQGIYVDAITEYEQALAIQTDSVEISMKMADAYLMTGNSKKFQVICKEYAESHQDDINAMNHLMEYYLSNDNQVSAVKYLNDFLESYPENENAQKWMLQLKGSFTKLYARYDELFEISNGLMVVKKDDGYGLADSKGMLVLEPVYEELYPFSEDGFMLAKQEGIYIYIDSDGQRRLLPETNYTDLGMMINDRTVAANNGKYGYLDEKLQPVTEFQWDKLTLIEKGVGAGLLNGKWALLDKDGETRTEYIYDDVIIDTYGLCSKQQRVFVKQQNAYYMVDKKGETIGELQFENAKPFTDDQYAAVCMNGKWGFVNEDGELIIECTYDDAQSFQNGFAAVCVDEKWGYIDENGHLVIEPQFEKVTAISKEGTAAVLKDEWELIQLSVFL